MKGKRKESRVKCRRGGEGEEEEEMEKEQQKSQENWESSGPRWSAFQESKGAAFVVIENES